MIRDALDTLNLLQQHRDPQVAQKADQLRTGLHQSFASVMEATAAVGQARVDYLQN